MFFANDRIAVNRNKANRLLQPSDDDKEGYRFFLHAKVPDLISTAVKMQKDVLDSKTPTPGPTLGHGTCEAAFNECSSNDVAHGNRASYLYSRNDSQLAKEACSSL